MVIEINILQRTATSFKQNSKNTIILKEKNMLKIEHSIKVTISFEAMSP